jgi:hypothetical protein
MTNVQRKKWIEEKMKGSNLCLTHCDGDKGKDLEDERSKTKNQCKSHRILRRQRKDDKCPKQKMDRRKDERVEFMFDSLL